MRVWLVLMFTVARALDDGLARTPPMGWRSWNAFGPLIDDAKMRAAADALCDTSRPVWGRTSPTSLRDLGRLQIAPPSRVGRHLCLHAGYASVGLDDGWQQCGAGVDGSFHDAAGDPLVNASKFVDLAAMVSYAHAKGVRVGWYHK
jgi:hypothetical protein